tara:strand:+ start:1297 stop:1521 length:225 start_codon:yes stop_codon:yes gene_type:complete
MINRYGLAPLAFALVIFTILIVTIIPSPHKACLDNNIAILDSLDREIYSDEEISKMGKSIGEGCKVDKNYQLST